MAKNFIIQFSGREGSSAIISALSAQKGVNVPLFEELDWRDFRETRDLTELPQALSEVFVNGVYTGVRRKLGYVQTRPENSKIETTGFKWRIGGQISEIAHVLRRHNVTVFALQRRDFLNYVCSLYIHKYGNQLQSEVDVPRHPHFNISSDTPDGARPDQRILLGQQDFRLDKSLFLTSARDATIKRQSQAGISKHLARAGVPVKMMYYEDFDANPKKFITHTLAEVGLDISASYSPHCRFEKVHKKPLAERISGIKKATRSWRYRFYEHEYRTATRTTESFCRRGA